MSFNRHQHFEELISASLGGELTDAERADLDAHLDACDVCRATLAAFADQRRIVAGLRHVPAPRDLGARVRTGIEAGAFEAVPWWRRPAVLFAGLGGGLAAVAGVLLALVVLNGTPEDPQVGVGSEAPSVSPTPAMASEPPLATPSASAAVAATPAATPTPQPEPVEADPQPDVYLAYTGPFDNLLLTLRDGRTGETLRELPAPGPAVAASLSPNGQFLAFITRMGESGMNQYWIVHIGADAGLGDASLSRVETSIPEWDTVALGDGMAGSEFLEHLAWSPSSEYLAYTVASPNGGAADAWAFDATDSASHQLTSDGQGYAGSWQPSDGVPMLWVSRAGQEPVSYQVAFIDGGGGPLDTNGRATLALPVFQPLVSPDGSKVIYWRGVMAPSELGWLFAQGASPYIADVPTPTPDQFTDERPLFSDVTIDRDAFTSAGIVWGADSDAYAVWDAEWTGIPQGAGGEYPSVNRVYFGHASDDRELTEHHAIDAADLPEGASVVDVKVPTTRHLLVTAQLPIGGVMDVPRASLILVTRNTGQVADEVFTFSGRGDEAWFGPGAYDAHYEAVAP